MYGKMSINVRFQEINKQNHRSVLKIIHSYAAWLWLTFHHIGARLNEALLLPRLFSPLRCLSSVDRTNDLGQKSLITRTLNRKTLYSLLFLYNQQSTQHKLHVALAQAFKQKISFTGGLD